MTTNNDNMKPNQTDKLKANFIKLANKKHGTKYNYHFVEYVAENRKVNIECPKHGGFELTPKNHLQGKGCEKCVKIKERATASEQNKAAKQANFIERANKVHHGKYDYSKAVYEHSAGKVEIICPVHGSFMQQAALHVAGGGCAHCAHERRVKKISVTTEEYIKRAKDIYGDHYDYSKLNYVNASTKVDIICREHGAFQRPPQSHLQGSGCPLCSAELDKIKIGKLTTEFFVLKGRAVHGDEFDYSLVNYVDTRTMVKIICKKHGAFERTPATHLAGAYCPQCYIEAQESEKS